MLPTLSEFFGRLWDPVATIAGAIGAAVVGHLWRKFRNRMVLLRCQITHTPVTNSVGLSDQVEVKYGGVVAPNLYLCTVLIQNDSAHDLDHVILNMAYKDGTIFLSGGGAIVGSNQGLSLTSEFLERNNRFLTIPEKERADSPEQAVLNAQRDFIVPVFNRGARAQFAFTVHGLTGVVPTLTVTCDHLGAKLVQQPPLQLFLGEPNDRAALIGFGAGIVLLMALPYFIHHSWRVSWLMFFVGATGILNGALLLKSWRGLLRMLS
jgi:hypothetical protein